MRNIMLDDLVRDRVIRIASTTVLGVVLTGAAVTALDPGLLRTCALLGLIASVAGGGAAMGMTIQQHVLGREVAASPLAVARWGGALVAAVLGPAVSAALLLGLLTLVGAFVLPTPVPESLAGVGVAWLVLPMALLVTGTASLRTVAVALDHPLEVRQLIERAEGHEWSLVPVGLLLAAAVVLCVFGIVGIALGMATASIAILAGLALLLPGSAALAHHWERLVVAQAHS